MRRYLEFSLALLGIGGLMLLLFMALQRTRLQAEAATVQAEAAALQAQLLEVLTRRELYGTPLPVSDNPVDWVGTPPHAYLGPRQSEPDEHNIWYYHAPSRQLRYRYSDGRQACFQLARGRQRDQAAGVLGGIGLIHCPDIAP